jgi:hypothetical protein
MRRGLIPTHAGDDSDGKIWGIEGVNILFILAGLLLSLGLVLMLARNHPLIVTVGGGGMPFLLITTYVFALRQGKPKAYDTDLLETLFSGTGWSASTQQPLNPLFSHAST